MPIIALAAILANWLPVALETNGTVLEALGFTSKTNTLFFLIANCALTRPITLSFFVN